MFFSEDAPAAARVAYDAIISPCGQFRYQLTRTWDVGAYHLVVVMLNPSTADARVDDPTILRLMKFAQRWGFGGIVVVNLYAYRSSKPEELAERGWGGCVGPDNERTVLEVIRTAKAHQGWVLAAWGNQGQERASFFIQRCRAEGVELRCLGLTNSGAPKHPLARGKHRVPDDFEPIPFVEAA